MEVEAVKPPKGGRRRPVGSYLSPQWANWLQTKRVELNAMATPQFIAWLDAKMAQHGNGKLIPPAEVMRDHLAEQVRHGRR